MMDSTGRTDGAELTGSGGGGDGKWGAFEEILGSSTLHSACGYLEVFSFLAAFVL